MAKQVQTFDEINITPLTDIFLVLLIIMMVVAPMLDTSGLKLANPQIAPQEKVTEEPKVIEARLTNGNLVMIDNQPVGPLVLRNKLRELKTTRPDGIVLIAEPSAQHELITRVIDAAAMVGINKVAIKAADADPEPSEGVAG